jgi:hypothetical protein
VWILVAAAPPQSSGVVERRRLINTKEIAMNPRSLCTSFVTAGVLASICQAGVIAAAAAQDQSATIVADQVRSQGFSCSNPSSAERIGAESAPNHTVYVLKCDGVTYRVILVPDQGAEVAQVN